MIFRKNEKLKTSISLLGFGCMRFPTNESGSIDEKEAFKMLDLAYDSGINYYDTAYFYHEKQSEPVLGKWIETKKRDTFYVATKSPVWICKDIVDFDRILDEQLTNLKTDYIDFYLLHALNKDRWQHILDIHLLDHLQSLIDSGKVRHLGFSFHDSYNVFDEIIHAYPWDFCQIQFNYMDINMQAGQAGYELARSMNIPVVVMEPIKGGQLANVPTEIRALFDHVQPTWSSASWALRWVANHDNVMVILSGMSQIDQVRDNLKTCAEFIPLNETELTAINKAASLYLKKIQVPCTNCRYCMPCPHGVNIPENFRLLNEAFIYSGTLANCETSYQKFMLPSYKASNCIQCGLCKKECPQSIDIPTELHKVDRILG